MSNQFVSVVIPVYNMDVELFNRAINSIKFNCEIIVVNDGSDKKYRYTCPGAKFINLEHNVGHLHARRIGVENATGDWIIFLDADDELSEDTQEVIDEIKDDHEKYEFKYNILVTDGDHKVKDDDRYGYVVGTDYHTMIHDFIDSKDYIDPFVTGKVWKREFLTEVFNFFHDYPNVRLGEDHLIMIKALSSENVDIYCSTKKFYIRHEPTTCKKLDVSASIDDKITVFENMQVFRDSLRQLMTDLDYDEFRKSFEDLAFRLSTCRIPMTQDFIDYLNKNGYNTKGIKPVRKVKYLDPTELNDYFRYRTSYCSSCHQFDEDDGVCRYGSVSDMVSACVNHTCRHRNINTDECNIYDYFEVSKDTELISISDDVNDGNYICSHCRYWDEDMYCCVRMDVDPVAACVTASCEKFDDRYGRSRSNNDFDKLDLDGSRSKCMTCRYHNCGAPFCDHENPDCGMYEPW